ncbi:MAG: Unknown protein [uncultured Sulfurovum sp.]|uniref:LysM domain-containing protein n=1 Tax=uncultured Sulfurovum sp. TaxID=269237 RepID=A0A6S6SR43_9BACT|nr:MAG: Unknown protein [uncultured Sulfurovum sp.]
MFGNQEDPYLKATKHARINNEEYGQSSSLKFVIFNFLFVLILALITFFYLKYETVVFSGLSSKDKAVLGVSETVDDLELSSDEEFMKILRVTDIESETKIDNDSALELRNSMKVLMNESSIKSQSSYTKAISRELDDKSEFKGKIVVVKHGDTLSSLSEAFYGNSMNYSKIVESNPELANGSYMLRVGQTIKIPY